MLGYNNEYGIVTENNEDENKRGTMLEYMDNEKEMEEQRKRENGEYKEVNYKD